MGDLEKASVAIIENQIENITNSLGTWVGDLIGRNFIEWRIDNLDKTVEKFNKACEKKGITHQQRKKVYARRLGYEWVNEASKENNPGIQDMWANLLLNAHSKEAYDEHLIFIDILKRISPIDKMILTKIRGIHFHVHSKHENAYILFNDKELLSKFSKEAINLSIANLRSLTLIEKHILGPEDCFGESLLQKMFLDAVTVR